MTLVAPKHLRGRMSRYTPEAIRRERLEWAAEAYKTHKLKDIAEALGVGSATLGTSLNKIGAYRPCDPLSDSALERAGIRLGRVSDAISLLDRGAYAAVVDLAARKGLTVAEAMAVTIKEAAQ